MNLSEAIKARHSVRRFTDKEITSEAAEALNKAIGEINEKSGLHIQLCLNEPEAFQASKPHYGSFQNCKNYIAIVSKPGCDEECGYYGEQLVLLAQTMGLNSCWVALTYEKGKAQYSCNAGEKLRIVIALGYGQTQGVPHKSKDITKLYKADGAIPDWFKAGIEAASLAPTAVNQQKFLFILKDNTVSAKPLMSVIGLTKVDLGIAKCHFEIGAGKDNFKWAE